MIAAPQTAPTAARPRGKANAADTPAARRAFSFGALCPECGGSIRVDEGVRSVRCGYCGSALLVASPRGVRSYIIEPKITAGKARLAAIHRIDEDSGGRLGARNTTIVDERLVHVPFWRMRGRIMGWVSGERSRLVRAEVAPDNPESGPPRVTMREERTPYSRLLFKRVDWSAPACVLPCLGLQGIAFRTDFLEWNILDAKSRTGRTLALPTTSERAARRDAMSYLTHFAIPSGARAHASRFHLFDSSLSLYYYPVYIVRYAHGGRIFTVTVDGGNGLVVRGEVPERRRVDARPLFFGPAALAALAATALPLVLVPAIAFYALDSIQARAFLPPHRWLAYRAGMLLGGEG